MPDVERLLNAIDAAEEHAYGADNDGVLESDRARAIEMYLGKNLEPAPEGRSQVVDRSVYETVQWILPSLCRIFANGDDVVELIPLGPDDEQAAKQESEYLNYVVTQRNRWFEVCYTWFTDALLTKNAYCYACWDTKREVEIERYERQSEESLAILLDDENIEVLSHEQEPSPDPPQPIIDPATGQPAIGPDGQPLMQQRMLHTVEIRKTRERGHVSLKVLPPERCKISEKTPSFRLDNCQYFEYFDFCTISELRKQGLDVPDDISDDETIDTEEDEARDQFGEDSTEEENLPDPSMRRVKCRYIWIQYDYDEDGIAERQYVVRVGRNVLYREECNRIPVACIVPNPLPHRHVGLSVADVVADIQRIKTAILRQGLDNLYLSNNPRLFVSDKINLDDVLISAPGRPIRARQPGAVFGQDIAPVPMPFVFPQAMEGLEYMDQVRENRTGTNRYFTGIDQNALNKTATGIQQLSTMAAQRVEQIARIFACGIEDLFSIVHELILKHGHQKDVVRLRGQWVTVDPSTWKKRNDMRISVGFAAGNKDAMVARLTMIAQFQERAIASGLPIVTPDNVYQTALEFTKASDFSAPERFWTDPKNMPPPQPPQPDPTVVAVEQMKAQNEQAIKAAEIQQQERDSQREAEIKKYEIDTRAQVELLKVREQAAQAERLEDKRAQTQAGLKQLEGVQAAQLEEHRTRLKNAPPPQITDQLQGLAEGIRGLAAELNAALTDMRESLSIALTAKRQIRRGKDGRAEGVDIVAPDGAVIASQRVVRGPDGRVMGTE